MQKVILITTSELEENGRIRQEARKLGIDLKVVDFRCFEYSILDSKLKIANLDLSLDDIVVMRGIFRSQKPISAHIEALRKKGLKVFDNSFLEHKFSINKITDLIKLAHADIVVPDSFHLHEFHKYYEAAGKLGYPMILKLTRTGKGAGVYKIEDEAELKTFVRELESREVEAKTYLLQKFIDYQYDLRILIIGGNVFCMRRIPKEGEFRANFSLGGSVELFDLDDDGKKLARRAMEAVGLAIAGVDMLIDKTGKRYILEVNHTPGMLGMEEATGENITRMYLEYVIGNAK